MKKQLGLVLAVLLAMTGLGGAAFAQPKATDATVVDGDVHKVVLENEHVRVFVALAASGAKSPMHTHPPRVLVSLSTARVKLTLPDGTTSILDVRPGQVMWVDAAEHSWELLSGEIDIVGIEVKSAASANK